MRRELDDDNRLQRYAELIARTGANIAPGQTVVIYADTGAGALVRAVATAAYRAGAAFVDTRLWDPLVDRVTVELAPEEQLGRSGSWDIELIESLDRDRGSFIQLRSPGSGDYLGDLDQTRVGMFGTKPWRGVWARVIGNRTVNWTIANNPDPEWARKVFGEPDLERLWREVALAVRLDEPDPVEAWARHQDRLDAVARWLNSLQLDSLHYRGPGTDLRVGVLPTSVFHSTRFSTHWGREHTPNLPTEEVFTAPDPNRAEGVITSTRPLSLDGSTMVNDLRFTLRDGRIVEATATTGADAVRAQLAHDAGASRFGELALVDGSSRVGQSGLVFCDSLFDENATSHIAYGHAFSFTAGGDGIANVSNIHTDFMVGSPDVEITGTTRDGKVVPIIRNYRFMLE